MPVDFLVFFFGHLVTAVVFAATLCCAQAVHLGKRRLRVRHQRCGFVQTNYRRLSIVPYCNLVNFSVERTSLVLKAAPFTSTFCSVLASDRLLDAACGVLLRSRTKRFFFVLFLSSFAVFE